MKNCNIEARKSQNKDRAYEILKHDVKTTKTLTAPTKPTKIILKLATTIAGPTKPTKSRI